MILDAQNQLSASQAFTADAISSNIIDLSVTGRKIGAGEPLVILVSVKVAADHTTGDETYALNVYTDDDVAFGSPTTLKTNAILYSALTQYAQIVIPVDPFWTMERYLAVYFDGAGTTPTLTASIDLVPFASLRTYKEYPNAYLITH